MMMLLVMLSTVFIAADALNGYCNSKSPDIVITIKPEPRIEATIGKPVSVTCAAHSIRGSDPYVYFVKGLGGDGKGKKGKHMGTVATGKSTLFFEEAEKEHIDTYQCVVESCCSRKQKVIPFEIYVADKSCKDVYGMKSIVYWTTWQYANWTEAVQNCKREGLEIALPKNDDENAKLLKDVQDSFKNHPNANKYAHENWVWIGATDSAAEGLYNDVNTGKKITYFNWQAGQPDNWKGVGTVKPKGQDCVGMNRESGEWDDSFISHHRPYACKCPKQRLGSRLRGR